MGSKQPPLASKDASLFRQVLKHYETKQYKKGLKAAEQILRKNPKHGETLAMKGLIVNCLGRHDEAFAIAKEALQHDMRSHVCWHVYGLLWRSVKNYDEAIKAYKFALKIEPDSQQILRDLAYLQIQMRDFTGYAESRRMILAGRPQVRANWTGLAIAHHLGGNLAEAENILSKFEGTLKQPPPKGTHDYVEHSEAGLYKNSIIAESGDIQRALDHLESIAKATLDKLSIMESRAKYLSQLERWEEAEAAYNALLERNPDCRAYYAGLEKCWAKGEELKDAERAKFKERYAELAQKYPKADSPKRVPLDFLEGKEFRAAADEYIKSLLERGVPSTFANIRALYADPAKRTLIPELVHKFLESQESAKSETNGDSAKALIWTLYFLAQHYDHFRTRDSKKALEYINRAIEASPNKVELHMTMARIHKHMGDLQGAMEIMNKARELDLKDRFINTKCAKYQLRNNCSEEALRTMSLFTRNEASGGPLGDLLEMQCVWFLTEDGESYARQKKYGLALKRYHAIWKDWTEDQFDFHSFSLRKGQIRAYIDMIRWETTLRSHPFFARAAVGAVKVYLQLADKPYLAHGSLANGGVGAIDFDSLSIADRKKALKKARREAQKQQEKEVAERAARKDEKKIPPSGEDGAKKEDDDPQGNKLAQTADPLLDVMRFLGPLLEFSPKRLEVQLVGFEVFLRKKKYLRALSCLRAAAKLDPEDPTLHGQIIRYKKAVDSTPDLLPSEVKTIIDSEFYGVLLPSKDTDLVSINNEYLTKHKDTPQHLRGALRAKFALGTVSPDELAKEVIKSITKGLNDTYELKDVNEGLELLKEVKVGEQAVEEFKKVARRRWETANVLA
ncbi:NMDA receptor-regulated protein 1 [Kalaharituber pfeilii]|nr:NMDA receptor-regulated protein 1 [Kalaharituber pfeilii]